MVKRNSRDARQLRKSGRRGDTDSSSGEIDIVF
jgi:hypothetical protein